MTDNIKELANLQVVLLGVTETNVPLQTESGKGVKTLTIADFTGSGGSVATVDNIVMKDTDGTLFFKRISSETPPVLTNWKLSDGSAYTITGTPVPYIVSSGLSNTELRASPVPVGLPSNASTETNQLIQTQVLEAIETEQSITKTAGQVLTLGVEMVLSAVMGSVTNRVVLTSTVDTWIDLGSAPVVVIGTAPAFFLPAGVPSYPIKVTPSVTKVCGHSTVAGKLSILESN
jgi:hypothetical protein